MAVTADVIKKEDNEDPDELSMKRYEELKEKIKLQMLKKLRIDRIEKNTSKVHEI